MDQVARLLANPLTAGVFVALICIAFLFCLKDFFTLRRIWRNLEGAISGFNAALSECEGSSTQVCFFKQKDAIEQGMSQNPTLKHLWTEFMEGAFWSSPDESADDGGYSAQTVYVSERPSNYFNRDAVLSSEINLSQFLAGPNYLIGMGLLCTFIGIAAALQVAQSGLSIGAGQAAMRDLLAVASAKFLSSLTGILLSLLLSISQRWALREIHLVVHKFCVMVEECTVYKSTAELLYDEIEEQKRQTQALNSMAANISESITQVLSNQLPASVTHALEPLAAEIKDLARRFSGSNQDALQSVLNEFLTQMRQNTGDEINNLVSTTRTLKDSLETLVGRMNSLGESFGSETTASSVRLTGAVEQFSASFLPVQQKLEGFASCITALESVAARIEQAGGNLSGAADLTHESNSKLAGTVSDIASNLAPLQTALTDLSIAFQQIARTSDDLRVAGQTISTAAHNLQSSSESISSAEERFHRKAELLESAATGISSAITGLERSSANVTAASDPLGALTERMHLAVEQMRETEARIVRGHEHLDSIVRELKNYAETVPSVWQSYETRFKGVDADMSAAFGQLAAQSGQFQSSVETFVKALDDSFSRSLQSLSGAIQELADEREQAAEVKIPAGRNP